MRWMLDYCNLLIVDHGVLRSLYSNCFKLPGGLFRANQPSPLALRRYRRRWSIRSVVNLRGQGASKHSYHRLETATCRSLGLVMADTTIWSRGLLFREQLLDLIDLIQGLELPALAHCKSGADRAGFFAVMYRHHRLGEPIESAIGELSWRYGHFKHSATGVLDHFFQAYLQTRRPRQSLTDWIRHDYDREVLQASFKPRGLSRWLVDHLLRRE
jgi:protein tyrosine/serine phosphatase